MFFPKKAIAMFRKTNFVIAKIYINTSIGLRLIGIFVYDAFFIYTDISIHMLRFITYK